MLLYLYFDLLSVIKISHKVGQPMSSYFLAEHDFVSLIWDKSIVGPGRGSSACWLTNYLLGLTQADAVKYDLPYYRFLSSERAKEVGLSKNFIDYVWNEQIALQKNYSFS